MLDETSLIEAGRPAGIPPHQQRFTSIVDGSTRSLEDFMTVGEYKLQDGCQINLILNLRGC